MKPPLAIDDYDDLNISDSEGCLVVEAVLDPAERDYIIAAVNACHKAGLTAEQLEQDAIGKAIEHLKWIKGNLERYGADAGLVEISYRIADALRPFTPEAK